MINYVAAGKTSFFPYFRLGLGARGEEVYWYNPAGIVITPMIIFMDRQIEDLSPNCGFPRVGSNSRIVPTKVDKCQNFDI